MLKPKLHLYFDDSGSRKPDHKPTVARRDKMDHFSLGGILMREDNIEALLNEYYDFMERWNLSDPEHPTPLHSTKIRSRQKEFAWLGNDKKREAEFLKDLGETICSLPYLAIACVVHRPGYNARYSEKYNGEPWMLCKTACTILIERAAKYADAQGANLEIYFEESGKNEDQDIQKYVKSLKQEGMPFDRTTSQGYAALTAADFSRIILGNPHRRTKATPMCQIADMILYPISKGGYDPTYPPYDDLLKSKKICTAR
jgi:hypothetical protein